MCLRTKSRWSAERICYAGFVFFVFVVDAVVVAVGFQNAVNYLATVWDPVVVAV